MNLMKQMLSESSGLAVTMVCNSFTTLDIAPAPELVTAVEYITIGALFGTSLDKFMEKK